jgi:hypothetical protein
MNTVKDNIRKYLDPLKVILVILGIALSYLNPKNALEYLLVLVALPLNVIPTLDLLVFHERQGDSSKDTHLNQAAIHHLTNSILIILAILLPAHGKIKTVLVLATLIFVAVEGVRHLIHSYFHKHPTKKNSHLLHFFLKGGLVALIIPLILYVLL